MIYWLLLWFLISLWFHAFHSIFPPGKDCAFIALDKKCQALTYKLSLHWQHTSTLNHPWLDVGACLHLFFLVDFSTDLFDVGWIENCTRFLYWVRLIHNQAADQSGIWTVIFLSKQCSELRMPLIIRLCFLRSPDLMHSKGSTVESGYQAHIAIKRTFAIRRIPSSCQNRYKPSLTGAVVGRTKLDEHEYERRALTSIRNEAN